MTEKGICLPIGGEGNSYVNQTPLACPQCGSEWLHHGAVTAFHRTQEEAEIGRRTTIAGDQVTCRGGDVSDNPSARRDGLKINFQCETCASDLVLNLAQHKGQTFVWWAV